MEKLFWNDAIAIHWIFLFISISILPAITARNMSCNSLTDLLTVNLSLVTHRTVDVPIKLKCQMPMSMNCDCCILRCRLAYRMQFDVTKFRTSNGITNKTCWNDWLHFVSAPVSVNRNQLWHSRYHSLFLLLLCFTRKHTHTLWEHKCDTLSGADAVLFSPFPFEWNAKRSLQRQVPLLYNGCVCMPW